MNGYVYFAGPASVDAVKIGWSTDPWSAVREGGNRWTWFGLQLFATVNCSDTPFRGTHQFSLEKQLHRHLASSRIEREWFRPTDDVLAVLAQARRSAGPGALVEWLAQRSAA